MTTALHPYLASSVSLGIEGHRLKETAEQNHAGSSIRISAKSSGAQRPASSQGSPATRVRRAAACAYRPQDYAVVTGVSYGRYCGMGHVNVVEYPASVRQPRCHGSPSAPTSGETGRKHSEGQSIELA
jgi:hypothetical protein